MAQVEVLVGEPSIFPPEKDGHPVRPRCEGLGSLLRTPPLLFACTPPGRRADHIAGIGERISEAVDDLDPFDEVLGIVRDPRDPPGVELIGPYESQP